MTSQLLRYRGAAARGLSASARGGQEDDSVLRAAILRFVQGGRVAELSARERRILALMMEGVTTKEIAERLGVSPSTVQRSWARTRARLQPNAPDA